MHIRNIFSVPIGWNYLDGLDNSNIIKYCKNLNRPDNSTMLDLNHGAIKSLVDAVNFEANQFHKFCGLKHRLVTTEAWYNEGNLGNICRPHTHPYAFSVATYYLNDSDVELNILNPINSLESIIIPELVESYTEYNRTYMSIPPKEGLLLVLPAWIIHYVDNIQDDRMSIAFNLCIEKSC